VQESPVILPLKNNGDIDKPARLTKPFPALITPKRKRFANSPRVPSKKKTTLPYIDKFTEGMQSANISIAVLPPNEKGYGDP
jgi:hypothetical protein